MHNVVIRSPTPYIQSDRARLIRYDAIYIVRLQVGDIRAYILMITYIYSTYRIIRYTIQYSSSQHRPPRLRTVRYFSLLQATDAEPNRGLHRY